jgi:hypothetical protein
MPVDEVQDPAAMLRAHVAAVVNAAQELEEARQRVAKSATALNDLIERTDSPLFKSGLLRVDTEIDLARRARCIASDVVGKSMIAVDEIPGLVADAIELQKLIEFVLTNATTKREEASHAV